MFLTTGEPLSLPLGKIKPNNLIAQTTLWILLQICPLMSPSPCLAVGIMIDFAWNAKPPPFPKPDMSAFFPFSPFDAEQGIHDHSGRSQGEAGLHDLGIRVLRSPRLTVILVIPHPERLYLHQSEACSFWKQLPHLSHIRTGSKHDVEKFLKGRTGNGKGGNS